MADSTGRCTGSAEHLSRCLVAERLSRPLVQLSRHGVEPGLSVARDVDAFGQILPKQAVRILVAAALPRTLRVTADRHGVQDLPVAVGLLRVMPRPTHAACASQVLQNHLHRRMWSVKQLRDLLGRAAFLPAPPHQRILRIRVNRPCPALHLQHSLCLLSSRCVHRPVDPQSKAALPT